MDLQTEDRNVIGRNLQNGIYITGINATGNMILGNYIGTNSTGSTAEPNYYNGIHIDGSPNNIIGGTTPGAGNLISGNQENGIRITGAAATGNVIEGNLIGTDESGTIALGNVLNGVLLNSPGNTVGGLVPEAKNVLSGNIHGVVIQGIDANDNHVRGNYIGTNATGDGEIPNTNHGIFLGNGTNNTIGPGNLISGNDIFGVLLIDNANGNNVIGNYIGTNAAGTSAIPNFLGVHIISGQDNFIGGTGSSDGNLISGNEEAGILIYGETGVAASGNVIQGNLIGTDHTGLNGLGNSTGIRLSLLAPGTIIGGSVSGARNVISGNAVDGIIIDGETATGTIILGNYIGVDADGTGALANTGAGILMTAGGGAVIGGTNPAERNVISGNDSVGIHLIGTSSSGNMIFGNLIGTNASGTSAIGNSRTGIWINNSSDNMIGDSGDSLNVISANGSASDHPGGMGIYIEGSDATGNDIRGNYIGTDLSGTAPLGNSRLGIGINNGVSNYIGGTSTGSGNLICANGFIGIRVYGTNANDNWIQNNYIGTNFTGSTILGNLFHGISIVDAVGTNIGGVDPAGGNVIAYNQRWGVVVGDYEGHAYGNDIRGNSIYSNGDLGINLLPGITDDGVTPNDSLDVDTGGNDLQNYPVLTSAASDVHTLSGYIHSTPSSEMRLEFFRNTTVDPSGHGEGEIFIGSLSVLTDIYGDAEFNVLFPGEILSGQYYTATATSPDSSTSEFSGAITTEIHTKSFGSHFIVNKTYSGVPLHWPDGKAEYVVSQSVADAGANFVTAIDNSYNTWSVLDELDYRYADGVTGAVASNTWGGDHDGYNNHVWITDWDTTGLDQDVVAATRVRYNAITGEMTDVDIAYNAQYLQWSANATPESDKLDMENVATHEIGHYSGLGDIYNSTDDPYYLPEMGDGNEEQTMYGLIKNGEDKKRTLYDYHFENPADTSGDVAGVEYIYSNLPDEKIDLVLLFDASE